MGRKNKKKPDEKELQNGKTRLTASSDSDKVIFSYVDVSRHCANYYANRERTQGRVSGLALAVFLMVGRGGEFARVRLI